MSQHHKSQSEAKTLRAAIIMPLGEQRGGGEKNLWDLMDEGRQGPVEWVVIFQQDGPLVEEVRNMGVETHVVPSGRFRDVAAFLKSIRNIASIVRRQEIDVIIAWMWSAHLYGSLAGLLSGRPSILSQVEVPDDFWLKRLVTRLPSRGILINSGDGLERLRRFMPGASKKFRLVYPGADLKRFDPDKLATPAGLREKLGLPVNGPVIGLVGRLQRWKGAHVLIKAMPAVLEKHPDATCVIVGGKHDPEPDYGDYLENLIQELNLGDKVRLAGLQRNIPEWMQAMDIVVHASDKEPFGLVIIEGMALGKPMVATDEGGPAEIITPEVHGILTPYGDSEALAQALCRYLGDPEFAAVMGSAARQRARDFSTSKYAENFSAAILDLCGR